MLRRIGLVLVVVCLTVRPVQAAPAYDANEWEITPESEKAVERGLKWLVDNQTIQGNWGSANLGLVSMAALAFLANGHFPNRGKYGATVSRALDYVLQRARPTGLIDQSQKPNRIMYNHGLSTFVLGQAFGMTTDRRIGPVLQSALRLIAKAQAKDGGWDYNPFSVPTGHDLSLIVMQAKALRSAADMGLEINPDTAAAAIARVKAHYRSDNGIWGDQPGAENGPGHFYYIYGRDNWGTPAVNAAGIVCLQEFGEYDDWRIPKAWDYIAPFFKNLSSYKFNVPFTDNMQVFSTGYGIYYLSQAMYQTGGERWKQLYPMLRDFLVRWQDKEDGHWKDMMINGSEPQDAKLWGTAAAVFALSIPNRYLPILQRGEAADTAEAAAKK